MTITINQEDVSQTALDATRASFNPSKLPQVDGIKLLAAALITECEKIRDLGKASREASIAITEIEAGAMWAVKAATKGL